jgi:ribosomal protein S12 methylthiotransferase
MRLMKLQEGISAARLQRKVGTTLRVLVDEVREDGVVARSSADAPEIDGLVHLGPKTGAKVGQFLDVRVTAADTHDLYAEVRPA